ncbi:hypothetical protein [Lihuaxuella thermophila]|uniref:Cupredoxin-like domain-containing protein n=1 Tax=Lihuaxuella thermophila TaxID=1173111 RepID=A0A1H8AGM6_9BACL|nr:hypothetical protein [Lihuaxuella thermophila]SEM69124.1 hypothetical protein SAMN05444955_101106 [Lihuaxuella thermophila]
MRKKLVLSFFAICTIFVLSAMTYADTAYPLQLNTGQPTAHTDWIYFPAGKMKIHIENKGSRPIHFYVLEYCPYYECSALRSGEVEPGKTLDISAPHPAGKYMFKMDNDEFLSSEASGTLSQ